MVLRMVSRIICYITNVIQHFMLAGGPLVLAADIFISLCVEINSSKAQSISVHHSY